MLPTLPEQASLSSSLCSDIWICFASRCRRRTQERSCSTPTRLPPHAGSKGATRPFPSCSKSLRSHQPGFKARALNWYPGDIDNRDTNENQSEPSLPPPPPSTLTPYLQAGRRCWRMLS